MFPVQADARKVSWWSATASYYSPADSGGPFACTGIVYNDWSIMGVAHKTLPCGTKIRFLNPRSGRRVTVRVLDRGPFVGGREFDFTVATKNRLHCGDLCRVLWRKR